MLTEVGASQEQFLLAAKRGLESADKKYFEQLITCDNYLYFKNMMIKRNLQLEEQAFNLMTEKEENGGNKVGTGNNSSIPSSKGQTYSEADYCNTNFKELQKIREATELECAIQMSLALEEEKKKLMDIENDELMRAIELSKIKNNKESELSLFDPTTLIGGVGGVYNKFTNLNNTNNKSGNQSTRVGVNQDQSNTTKIYTTNSSSGSTEKTPNINLNNSNNKNNNNTSNSVISSTGTISDNSASVYLNNYKFPDSNYITSGQSNFHVAGTGTTLIHKVQADINKGWKTNLNREGNIDVEIHGLQNNLNKAGNDVLSANGKAKNIENVDIMLEKTEKIKFEAGYNTSVVNSDCNLQIDNTKTNLFDSKSSKNSSDLSKINMIESGDTCISENNKNEPSFDKKNSLNNIENIKSISINSLQNNNNNKFTNWTSKTISKLNEKENSLNSINLDQSNMNMNQNNIIKKSESLSSNSISSSLFQISENAKIRSTAESSDINSNINFNNSNSSKNITELINLKNNQTISEGKNADNTKMNNDTSNKILEGVNINDYINFSNNLNIDNIKVNVPLTNTFRKEEITKIEVVNLNSPYEKNSNINVNNNNFMKPDSSKLNLGQIKDKKVFQGNRIMNYEKQDLSSVKSKIESTNKLNNEVVTEIDKANDELAKKYERIQKEKQSQLIEYRDLILKMKKEKRNVVSQEKESTNLFEIHENQSPDDVKKRLQMRKQLADRLKK